MHSTSTNSSNGKWNDDRHSVLIFPKLFIKYGQTKKQYGNFSHNKTLKNNNLRKIFKIKHGNWLISTIYLTNLFEEIKNYILHQN